MNEPASQRVTTVTLRDGARKELPPGGTIRDLAFQIGERLGRATVGGRIDGAAEISDLRTPLLQDCRVDLITADSPDGLHVIRHSAAHIMADAILSLWPAAKLAIGPAIDEGFYYDIDLDQRLTPEDLPRIEAAMQKVIAADTAFERCTVDRSVEIVRARERGDIYKAELMEGIAADAEVTFYRHGAGAFEDLCRGPHVPSTGYVKAFRLQRLAGAYWRGDEKNRMLQRVYGTAFYSKKELEEHLARHEEALKRDHRKLGRELGLFLMDPVAPASPFFLPKGALIYNRLQQHMRELYRESGYQEVITPQIFDASLWHRSGHYEHYKDNMFFTKVDEHECAVKPMNCPAHTIIFAAEKRSYRELPLRIADFGRLHRYERSGVTSGLTRVRTFCQDDGHIFAASEQIQAEITALIAMVRGVYTLFGFNTLKVFLSTRPKESVGSDAVWEQAEQSLRDALGANGVEYVVNAGDGAFYGPKIDFIVLDALKREWQLGTIQLDFNLPERFDLNYVASDGSLRRPVMIHRAILGSIERFIGILIEHTGGNFPFWLAPEQVRVCTIADTHEPWAREVLSALMQAGVRCSSDFTNSKTGAKIRDARLARLPFTIVVGGRECEERTVALRERPDVDRGTMGLPALLALFTELERSKA
ncbi:MAG: threonine--tRNA ligase [Planctomycetes bacterium]|nr:threonine--tRNA ligase [Planctomycetota bacterium]